MPLSRLSVKNLEKSQTRPYRRFATGQSFRFYYRGFSLTRLENNDMFRFLIKDIH
jgi:hypothetical protein